VVATDDSACRAAYARGVSFPERATRDAASEHGPGWMRSLSEHYERIRRQNPTDELCVVFDIDGTILDLRHLVVHVLLGYDREHGTDHFRGAGRR
jgi:hypothetical protein